mmetsp:Transcript_29748/g.86734  ORF Transcript_29748/g.86734 Transcript_29748/m.86734 type:complete len:287 (-) Transcript_29748:130-990(-)
MYVSNNNFIYLWAKTKQSNAFFFPWLEWNNTLIFRLAGISHEMQRRSHSIAAIITTIAIELVKQAMQNTDGSLLRSLAGTESIRHFSLNEARAADARGDVGMIPGKDHGVARQQGLAQAVAAEGIGVRSQPRLGMLGDEVHGNLRRAQGALDICIRNSDSPHIRRSRTGPRHDDAAHLGTQQGQKGIRHALRSPKVGIHHLLGRGTGIQPNTGVVHQPVKLLGLELLSDGFGGRLDGGLVGHINENRLDGVGFAGGPLDVGHCVFALGVGSGPEEDVAAPLDELLA